MKRRKADFEEFFEEDEVSELQPDIVKHRGKSYKVWKVTDEAGIYILDNVADTEAAQLMDSIIDLCNEYKENLTADLEAQLEAGFDDEEDEYIEEDVNDEDEDVAYLPDEPQEEIYEEEDVRPYLIREKTGEKILIDKDVFKLGKDPDIVDYFVDSNPTISRNHADIITKEKGIYVRDNSSLNHTFINGVKIDSERLAKLKDGCKLQLSDEVFEVFL